MRRLSSGFELPEWYGELVLRHRVALLLLFSVVTVLAAYRASQIPIQRSLVEAFVDDPAEYQAYRRRAAEFGGDSDDLIYLATREGRSVFNPDTLNAIRAAARRLEEWPEIERVECLPDAYWAKSPERLSMRQIAARAVARRRLSRGELTIGREQLGLQTVWPTDAEAQQQADLDAIQQGVYSNPWIRGALISNDGSAQIMVVQLVSAADMPLPEQIKLPERLHDCLRSSGLGREGVYSAGVTVSQGWMFRELARALYQLFPVGMIVICLTVYSMFHRLSIVVLTAIIGLVATVWGLGFTGMVFGRLGVLVAAAPLLVFVISTSDVIHLANAYRVELSRGLEREAALLKAVREVGGACVLTSITTFVGFISLMAIPAPSTRHVALAAAVGVASALLLAITVVPIAFAVLAPLPPADENRLLRAVNRRLSRIVDRCQFVSLQWPWTVIASCVVLLIGSVAAVSQIRVDVDFPSRFAERHPLRRSTDFFRTEMAGTTVVEMFIAAEPEKLLAPETLRALARVEDQIGEMPEVSDVYAITDAFRAIDEILPFDGTDRLPNSVAAARACLKLADEIDPARLRALIAESGDQTRLSIRMKPTGYLSVSRMADKMQQLAQREMPEAVIAESSGSYSLVGRIIRRIVGGQLMGLATCYLGISVIMTIGLRSFRVALLAQIPNILPVLVLVAILALTRNPVDTDMLGLPTVALGLAVDDTVHFLHRYRLQMMRLDDRQAALETTYRYTGAAILQTTLVLCIGLIPFAFSRFLSVWMLGLYLPLTLLIAVLADLVLLPAMLKTGVIRWASAG